VKQLRNVVGRVQSPWRPATAEESFEIVRRRLFENLDHDASIKRDAVISAYADLYAGHRDEFPGECREGEYRRRMQVAYPIHPELFDRLYSDWSTLERFQRTRGVLRLMAAVVHELWVGEDSSLLIMPGTVPIHQESVLTELTRYLEDNWKPIIERDVDGPNALPVHLDRENSGLGRYAACRRVARTVYLGSAPTVNTKHPGLEDKRIKLGCVQPGETPAVFGDALRRLSDKATYLATDGTRYYFTVKPTLNRLAQERAEAMKPTDVEDEIIKALHDAFQPRGEFCGVHIAPESPGDVGDEPEVRLVVLGPAHPHSAKSEASEARARAAEILADRGTGPRRFRNMLVFVAADRSLLESLEQAVRLHRAWALIRDDRESLNLGPAELRQVESRVADSADAVRHRIADAWQWVLVPVQPDPQGDVEWRAMKVTGDGPIAARVWTKLAREEQVITQMAGTVLRMWLDRIPLWKGDGISVHDLALLFAQYPYLPRLRDENVLLSAVQDGVRSLNWQSETFAYAEALDEASGEYRGFHAGEVASISASGWVVKPEVAARTPRGFEVPFPSDSHAATPTALGDQRGAGRGGDATMPPAAPVAGAARATRFHATVALDPMAPGGDAAKVAEHVLKHLNALPGAVVRCELDIEAELPGGVPDDVRRTVSENAAVLKFRQHGFEE